MTAMYQPSEAEKVVYDLLWKKANPREEFEIGGKQTVDFFAVSNIDLEILRQIWSLSTPLPTMTVDNFYTALRYITLYQRGIALLDEGGLLLLLTAC
jgi:hypothetical protein